MDEDRFFGKFRHLFSTSIFRGRYDKSKFGKMLVYMVFYLPSSLFSHGFQLLSSYVSTDLNAIAYFISS